jgi:hypothetical protein
MSEVNWRWVRAEEQRDGEWVSVSEWVKCASDEEVQLAVLAMRETCLAMEAQTGRQIRILVIVDERGMREEVLADAG